MEEEEKTTQDKHNADSSGENNGNQIQVENTSGDAYLYRAIQEEKEKSKEAKMSEPQVENTAAIQEESKSVTPRENQDRISPTKDSLLKDDSPLKNDIKVDEDKEYTLNGD